MKESKIIAKRYLIYVAVIFLPLVVLDTFLIKAGIHKALLTFLNILIAGGVIFIGEVIASKLKEKAEKKAKAKPKQADPFAD